MIMEKKPTLALIAERTGYSVSTVSRVLNSRDDNCRISAKVAEAIRVEAERCNYPTRSLAQILQKSRTRTIGVVLPSVVNPFFAEICEAILKEAIGRGYSSIVAVTMENADEQAACISTLMAKKVDGILAAPCGNDSELFENLNNTLPVVFVDRFFIGKDIPYVTSNNYKGAYDATMMLINSGHRNIACVQGDMRSLPNKRRVEGFRNAMKAADLLDNAVVVGDEFSTQSGYLEAKLLLSRENRPTAIFALSYTLALGVMQATRDSSLVVGKDVSVISFDDNISLDYMQPPLTRVNQVTEEMGKLATKILIGRIEGTYDKVPQLELNTELIVRDSVAAVSAE